MTTAQQTPNPRAHPDSPEAPGDPHRSGVTQVPARPPSEGD